jgi:hypothetical protein
MAAGERLGTGVFQASPNVRHPSHPGISIDDCRSMQFDYDGNYGLAEFSSEAEPAINRRFA